jgi:galactose mutarotase-like enzyme
MFTNSEQSRVDAWSTVVMQNDAMRVAVIPEIGGKIVSLVSRRTGREWLWKNPYLPLKRPPPSAKDFGAFDAGGWDEVFPTVNPCRVPNSAWGDRMLTDHGELWYRPWQIVSENIRSQDSSTLTLAVDDPELPFRFERTLTLAAGFGRLAASYCLVNLSKMPLPFIWAAHPLLTIEPGDSIHLPAGTPISSTSCVGLELAQETTEFLWPSVRLATGDLLDISRAPEPSVRYAIKLFAENAAHAAIKIAGRAQNEALIFYSEPHHASHTGLWLNYGAWSGANTAPYYNAGIEPTTFPHDELKVAAIGQIAQLAPGTTRRWELLVSIEFPNGTYPLTTWCGTPTARFSSS